jgi:methyl-accepting chemotaxis protein
VAEISGVICEIAASAQEQATGLAQVNTAVNQMDQLTQQNAANRAGTNSNPAIAAGVRRPDRPTPENSAPPHISN